MPAQQYFIIALVFSVNLHEAICAQYFRKWIKWQTTNVSYGTTVAQNGSLSLTMCLRRCEDTEDCVSAHVNKADFSCELSNYYPPYNTLTATPRNGWTVYYRELRQVQGIRAWIPSIYGDCYAENGIDGQVVEYFDIRFCRCTHSWGPNSFWIMEFQFPGTVVMVTPYFRTGMAVQRNTFFRLWVYKSYDDARNDVAGILCTEYTGPGIQSLTNFICKQQPYGGALKIQHFLKDEVLQFCEMKVFVV